MKENQNIEFKQSWRDEYLKWICGYANAGGIEKINQACRDHGIKLADFDYSMSGLMVSFHANPKHLPDMSVPGQVTGRTVGGEKLGEKLGEKRALIVISMLNNPAITVAMLAETLKISTTAVENNIRILKKQGYITRIGPAKGGHWEVLK